MTHARRRRCPRRASSSCRPQFEAHSAHVLFRAVVHYPWHPAHGSTIDVHYREKRGGEDVLVCTLPNAAAAVVVPAWMFDRALCSRLTLGPRRASVPALREVRAVIDEVRSAKPTGSSGIVRPEEIDGEATSRAQPIDGPKAADGDHLPDQREDSGFEDSSRDRRSSGTSSARSRTTRHRRRGAR